ncbi:putative extracelular cellulose binding protein (Cip2) [Aspergillus thermomutatus]|uniref:(4-O-methyl)-D-glucuronate--lignin esterase n=1 Tax=Aspergillus thermomutatus TaxID=41047 RepID=A0A397HQ21_ASPTH|nr:uncharacterized protein CDV56_106070 [Aspergillus thermomutatus]RHZ62550.1 hypothetical protein CDV56_106070 [Aspergillus thermomutatus]
MILYYSVLLCLCSIGALAANCTSLPPSPQLQSITTLPDPFSWYPLSQSGRVATLSDWKCRQSHISTLLQQLELGTKPPAPSSVTSTFTQNKLTITASNAGKTISFTATITYPSGTGAGPYPAMIAYGGLSIPLPPGVASITFDNSQIAQQTDQSSRGRGLFYDLYGANHSAGAMIAWAWATSLLIDRLEATPAARINTPRIGVTGCSRNGKGALVAGAFDPRIALTVPQESGTGGSGCWRLAQAEDGAPQSVQTAGEIVQENVWFASAFETYANDVELLPFDHHLLAGLVAPRGLLSIDNAGYQWLGPWSALGCMGTARLIWQAMGVPDYMGYSMSTDHPHCSFPDQQRGDLFAFIDRFLLGMEANTTVQKNYAGIAFDSKPWMSWEVPTLT